jgi:hypothetical protein
MELTSRILISTDKTRVPREGIQDPIKLRTSPSKIRADKKMIAFSVSGALFLIKPDLFIEYNPQPNPITANAANAVTIILPLPGRSMRRMPHVFSRFGIG